MAIFKDIYDVPFESVRYDPTLSYVGCIIVLNIMFDMILENVQLSLTKKNCPPNASCVVGLLCWKILN